MNRDSKPDPLRYHRKYEQLSRRSGDRIERGIEAISRAECVNPAG